MKKIKKLRPSIESEYLIKEVITKSYEIVRLTKVKYADNDYNFIDIRFYQRGTGSEGQDVY